MIRIVAIGILRQYAGGQENVPIQGWAGRPVHEMLDHLGIPSALVGAVLVNGSLVQKDHLLQEGDEVRLVPLMGGG